MVKASYVQTSFLGGEISQWAQGRLDRPQTKMALNKASNVLVVDEGAATRRPGFQFNGVTRFGKPGRVMSFEFQEETPNNMEFTDGFLRFWDGGELVTTNDSQVIISTTNTNPAVFSVTTATNWATGDHVYFTFDSPFAAVVGASVMNRQFALTMLSTTQFILTDVITGQYVNGSQFNAVQQNVFIGAISEGAISSLPFSGNASTTVAQVNFAGTVNHIAQITTPYTVAGNDWHTLRAVQGLDLVMLLHTSVAPQALALLDAPTAENFAVFEYSQAQFQDGPYLDPPANAIATPSAVSGSITLTTGYPAYSSSINYGVGVPVTSSGIDYISLQNNNINNTPASSPAYWKVLTLGAYVNTAGFVSTDVGRMVRLFSAPPVWSPATTYAAGATVTYNSEYFTSLVGSNTNNEPDISLTDWVINPSGALYSWGIITAVSAANVVTLQIMGPNLLYTTPCPNFQVGAWSNTTGWPTCGCYYQGRFWYGGAVPNRIDSSQSNAPFIMSPTDVLGNVEDNCGISYTFNSNSVDDILWMEPLTQGLLIGTQKGEYLLNTGTAGSGPITPSNIADAPATKYGSANMLPVKTGLTMCFVQRYARRMLEYLADVFSQRFYGPDLTTFARHIGQKTFQELAYTQEPAPVVWARMGDGSLVGTTYRRISLFSTQEPEFNAWHQHPLGSNRIVESLCVGPSPIETTDFAVPSVTSTGGALDMLTIVTNDPSTNIRYVESMTPLMDETDPLTSAWFLDAAVVPGAAELLNGAVTFYGLSHLNGYTVSVLAACIDCGDWLIENGQVTIPLGTVDPITGYTFDMPQFNILQPLIDTFEYSVQVVNGGMTFTIPALIGFNYQTQGQLCRPMSPQDTGSRNGPGFAKKRKTAWYGIWLSNALGVKVGTNLGPVNGNMKPVPTVSPMGRQLPYLQTFSGIKRETLGDDESFDSMVAWQTTRPYPATVTAFGGFIDAEDI